MNHPRLLAFLPPLSVDHSDVIRHPVSVYLVAAALCLFVALFLAKRALAPFKAIIQAAVAALAAVLAIAAALILLAAVAFGS